MYNKRAYADAARYLYAATTTSKYSRDPMAHYYLANTLLQLHRRNDAVAEYKVALELSPQGSIAQYCRAALKGLGMAAAAETTAPLRGAVGMKLNLDTGEILAVHPDSPAARVGLRVGDRVIAVDGRPLSELDDVVEAIAGRVGSVVRLSVVRGAETNEYALTRVALTSSGVRTEPSRFAAASKPVVQTLAMNERAVDVDDMIEMVKPTDMHPELTADFIADVKGALGRMPPKILQTLRGASIKVVLTPTMIDRYPELKNERPRGYHAGGSYKNCPAMFDSPNIVVCEYYFESGRAQWLRQPDPVDALRHETGHALDSILGRMSDAVAFVNAYKQDFERLTEGDKRDLRYYCYNNDGAHSETFAELTSCLLGSKGYWTRKLAECFPHTTDAVRSELTK